MGRADRVSRRVITDGRCDHLLLQLCQLERRAVYCGFLDYAIRRGSQKAPGYAAHLFQEVFGTWPRPCDRGPPAALPNFSLIREWLVDREKRDRKKRRVIKIEKPAPLLVPIEHQLEIDANGFIPGTYMTPADFEVDWAMPDRDLLKQVQGEPIIETGLCPHCGDYTFNGRHKPGGNVERWCLEKQVYDRKRVAEVVT